MSLFPSGWPSNQPSPRPMNPHPYRTPLPSNACPCITNWHPSLSRPTVAGHWGSRSSARCATGPPPYSLTTLLNRSHSFFPISPLFQCKEPPCLPPSLPSLWQAFPPTRAHHHLPHCTALLIIHPTVGFRHPHHRIPPHRHHRHPPSVSSRTCHRPSPSIEVCRCLKTSSRPTCTAASTMTWRSGEPLPLPPCLAHPLTSPQASLANIAAPRPPDRRQPSCHPPRAARGDRPGALARRACRLGLARAFWLLGQAGAVRPWVGLGPIVHVISYFLNFVF
jgi:hypothetical protein